MQVPSLPRRHSTTLLAEITPFDPEEDELDGGGSETGSCGPEAGSDTMLEEWWVLGEAGRGSREGRRGAG